MQGLFWRVAWMCLIGWVFGGLTCVLPLSAHSQTGTNTVVAAVAAEENLPLLTPDQVPSVGTFWLVMSNPRGTIFTVPLPWPPLGSGGLFNVYAITWGEFLVDETTNDVSTMSTNGIAPQASQILNVIDKVQAAEAPRPARMAMAMGMDIPFPGALGTNGDSGNYLTNEINYTWDTNQLWMQITNVASDLAYANLYNATNRVYAIWSSTDLVSWQVETEVWPANTNCQPFTIFTLDRQDVYLRAEDWTGIDSDGDGVPDWWAWEYWGTTNLSDTNLDYSGNGNTFVQDYSNNIAPTVFTFTSLEVTNNYFNTSSVALQLNVTGKPYYISVSVDDTNFQADAFWQPYTGPNMVVNLGITEGWHGVCIGLRGHGDDPINAVWVWRRLKLDFTPPALFVTNPINPIVDIPLIQLQGFSPEALGSISYDLTNAAGLLTNQQVLVLNQVYDTNTFEFTTNTFQAFDVILTNGVNTFTFHATDLAGNTTTTNYSVTLDYSGKTNPPSVQVTWPQDGTQVSGSSFTLDGQVADATVAIAATITDSSGDTNTATGLVERSGKFWVQNLPLNSGTNTVTLTATDAAGNVATTNISVIQSIVTLTVNPVGGSLWQPTVNVTGTISDPTYSIWVNGVKGHNNGDGTWSANNVPVDSGGTASFTAIGYAPNEQQPDGSYGN